MLLELLAMSDVEVVRWKEAVVNERRKASPLRIIVGVGGDGDGSGRVVGTAADATATFTKPPSGS